MTDPPEPSAAFLVMALGRRYRARAEEKLSTRGMSMRHLSALGHLEREPGCSYSELARRAGITPQSMQATLRQLEERGAVARATPAGRGRTAALHVTDDGAELTRWTRAVLAGLDDELLAAVPAEQRATLVSALFAAFHAGLA